MSEMYNPPPTAPPPSGPVDGSPGLPWDRGKSGNALIETAKGLITAPGRAYAEMREKGDYMSPVLFAVIIGTVGAVIGQIWNLVFGAGLVDMMPAEMQSQWGQFMAPGVGSVVLNIVLAPLYVLIGLFIGAAIFHLFLLLVGGTKESTAGFEGTVRAVGYGSVANVAQIIPVVGSVIAMVWGLVLYVIGLSRVHHTSTGKAVAAVLLPLLLCCVCVIILAVTMGAGLAAMFANQ